MRCWGGRTLTVHPRPHHTIRTRETGMSGVHPTASIDVLAEQRTVFDYLSDVDGTGNGHEA